MVYNLENTSLAEELFSGWNETLIWSCLQKTMGRIYVTDIENPKAARAYVGCFSFFAGEPTEELVSFKNNGFEIMIPQNEKWAKLIEKVYGKKSNRRMRYAIRKDTQFDVDKLRTYVSQLPKGYKIEKIDAKIYDQCMVSEQFCDFVSSFDSKDHFLEAGLGMVVTKDGLIVSGASSYTVYRDGIEIEVDTLESERRKHLASAVCSALMLECLRLGKYPSWDAQNMNSVHLAEKLGYEFGHEYPVYEVE